MRALGYARVSTIEQADGYGLQAQHARIHEHCEKRDLTLVDVLRDEGLSGKTLHRPALTLALERIMDGDAGALVVAKLDRLTRSVQDFARLLDWFSRHRAHLVVLDCEVDTTTPAGEAMANVMATFAQFERRLISQRTRDGLSQRRALGLPISPPAVADRPELAERIRALRLEGLSLARICERLNAEGVPTVRAGAVWRPSALVSVLGYERRPRLRVVELPERMR